MNKRLKNCPVCNSRLDITEYHCPDCNTKISGNFRIGDFSSLNVAQQEFVKTFICCEGSIKKVEKRLKISYPTVKNRLAEIKEILCPTKPKKRNKIKDNLEILNKIDQGNLSVEEALEKIKGGRNEE